MGEVAREPLIASIGFLVEFLLQTVYVFCVVATGQAPWN
jgi:hypothetical protein